MRKKKSQKLEAFDRAFDKGKISIDFSKATKTSGLSQLIKLPPFTIPAWLNQEIEGLAKLQANSKAAVLRQLLVEAVQAKQGSHV